MGQSSRFPFTSVLKQFSDPILYLHGGCNCRGGRDRARPGMSRCGISSCSGAVPTPNLHYVLSPLPLSVHSFFVAPNGEWRCCPKSF